MCERDREERFDSGTEKEIGTRNIRNGTVQLKEKREEKKTPLKGEPSTFKKSAAAVGRAVEKFRESGLRRLSSEQAAFFYINSSDAEAAERVILEADRNEHIANPVGYLVKVLGIDIRKAKGKELLFKGREEGEEGHPENGAEKFLEKLAEELNISVAYMPYESKREELARAVYDRLLSEEEKERINRVAEEVKEDMRKRILIAMIWHTYIRRYIHNREQARYLERYLV